MRLCKVPEYFYQVLVALMEGWGNGTCINGETGFKEPLWKPVRRIIFNNSAVFERDLYDYRAIDVPSLLELTEWIAPKIPKIRSVLSLLGETADIESKRLITEAIQNCEDAIAENKSDPDERFEV